MTFAAIAWDVDGTLVDSEPRHHRALLAASREFGVDLSDLPDQAFRGVHMGDVWTILASRYPRSLAFVTWRDAINAAYVVDREPLIVMPGAVETIETLATACLMQACVSNSNRSIVDANISALGIERHLACRVTLDDVENGKPDPEPYLKAAHLLGLPPDRIVAVEDSEAGLAAARAAGLYCVHYCESGAPSPNAHSVIGQLDALPKLIRD